MGKALKNNRPSNCLVNGQTSKTDKQRISDMETEVDNNNPQRKRGLDVNRYATKKTIAQGMLDVALLTANASQLKYVLQLGEERHEFYHLMLALIILSIVLQVLHAIFLFIIGPMNVENPKTEKVLMILNHVAMSLGLATMFIDIIKMVFVHHKELPYSPSPEL